MKKSTIFFLFIIYVVSIVVIGFFGAAMRFSNEYYYVESIVLSDPTNTTLVEKSVKEGESYVYSANFVADANGKCSVSIKASVRPEKANEKKVICVYDTSKTSYMIKENPDEFNVFVITFNEPSTAVGKIKATDIKGYETSFVITCK